MEADIFTDSAATYILLLSAAEHPTSVPCSCQPLPPPCPTFGIHDTGQGRHPNSLGPPASSDPRACKRAWPPAQPLSGEESRAVSGIGTRRANQPAPSNFTNLCTRVANEKGLSTISQLLRWLVNWATVGKNTYLEVFTPLGPGPLNLVTVPSELCVT